MASSKGSLMLSVCFLEQMRLGVDVGLIEGCAFHVLVGCQKTNCQEERVKKKRLQETGMPKERDLEGQGLKRQWLSG